MSHKETDGQVFFRVNLQTETNPRFLFIKKSLQAQSFVFDVFERYVFILVV